MVLKTIQWNELHSGDCGDDSLDLVVCHCDSCDAMEGAGEVLKCLRVQLRLSLMPTKIHDRACMT